MVRLKGYEPIYVLMGLVLVVFLLLILFKLFGQWGAFEYEQQAEISTKNLQTAMNQVCISGETQEVSINLPQQLSYGGIAKNPVSLGKALVDGDTTAVADSLRYMSALDSYGDPWYIIYYENFPQGEDSGWQGWSDTASQRLTSTYFTTFDIGVCMAPVLGDLTRFLQKAAKGAKTAEEVSDAYSRSRSLREMIDMFHISQSSPTLRMQTLKEIGSEIIKKSKGGYEQSVGKLLSHFEIASSGSALNSLAKHMTSFKRIDEEILPELDNSLNAMKNYLSRSPTEPKKIDEVLSKIGNLKTNSELTEGAYKYSLNDLLSDGDLKEFYQASGNMMSYDVAGVKLIMKNKGTWTDTNAEYLDKLVEKIANGEEISDEEIRLARHIVQDPFTHQPMAGTEAFIGVLENTQTIQKDFRDIKSLSNNLLDDLPQNDPIKNPLNLAPSPIQYSRDYLTALSEKRLSLPTLAAYSRFIGKRGALIGKNSIDSREGRWMLTSIGGSFVFNQVAVTPFEQAQYKFYPCSGNSLCMKSAVNPAINIYPLDDCKAVGINYIELDKTPADAKVDENTGAAITSGLNSMGSFLTGGNVESKFYSAAPCSGKMQIEKTTCNCKLDTISYVDTSSIDKYDIKCKIPENFGGKTFDCTLYRNRTYMGDSGEVEEVDKFTASAGITKNNELNAYEISFDLSDPKAVVFGVGSVWDETHFGDYYKKLNEDISGLQSPTRDYGADVTAGTLSLGCSVLLTNLNPKEEFDCPPIALPAIPFKYYNCSDASNYWLKCADWEKSGEATLVKDGLDGKTNVPANVWCCHTWAVSNEIPGGGQKEILSVPSCEMYPADKTKEKTGKTEGRYDSLKVTSELINNNLRCSQELGNCITIKPSVDKTQAWKVEDGARTFSASFADLDNVEITPASGITWSAGPTDICLGSSDSSGSYTVTPVSSGDCVVKAHYEYASGSGNTVEAIYTQKIESSDDSATATQGETKPEFSRGDLKVEEDYVSLISPKVWSAIATSYELTLPKETFGNQDDSELLSDPNEKKKLMPKPIDEKELNSALGVGKLYWYNLPPNEKTDCLKVRYVIDDAGKATSGFCYTSPTAWTSVKSMGWMMAATAVDIGTETLIAAFTGGGGVASGVGSLTSCMASNMVMYYGEQAVSKEKQASYWPNNIYFANYFR